MFNIRKITKLNTAVKNLTEELEKTTAVIREQDTRIERLRLGIAEEVTKNDEAAAKANSQILAAQKALKAKDIELQEVVGELAECNARYKFIKQTALDLFK